MKEMFIYAAYEHKKLLLSWCWIYCVVNLQVLCMVPTRELASQVASNFSKLASGLEVLCVYGGTPYYPQGEGLQVFCMEIMY